MLAIRIIVLSSIVVATSSLFGGCQIVPDEDNGVRAYNPYAQRIADRTYGPGATSVVGYDSQGRAVVVPNNRCNHR